MTYNNLEEIYQAVDETRARLVARVADLSPEQLSFRPDAAQWNTAEVLEHLHLIETGLTRVIAGLTAQAEAAGATMDGKEFAPFSLAEFATRAAGQKFNAPEPFQPAGGKTLGELLPGLEQSRQALRALRPRLEQFDVTGFTYPHAAFGPLNGYQWLAFLGGHEARHAAQIKNILAAFPA
jgi:hypothetical protein